MSTQDLGPNTLECDAKEVELKYGAAAKLYAETRSAAAEMAGNIEGKDHWNRVAAKLSRRR